jgi:hypothetical protein
VNRIEERRADPAQRAPAAGQDVKLLSAQQVLNDAADKVTAKDVELKPGQYRYPEFKGAHTGSVKYASEAGTNNPVTGYTYLVESTIQRWIPQDYTQEWLEKRTSGDATWLGGSMPQSEAPAYKPSDTDQGDLRGKCGDFYRALAKIDGVKVVDEATTADGRKGIALGLESEAQRVDLIVDPANGDFIGERTVAGPKPNDSWVKPGTVTGYKSVTTKVADAIGVVPAS